jgi:hypothetical protein
MPNNLALSLVEQMVAEGRTPAWFKEQFESVNGIDHFKDLVFSLEESVDGDYSQAVREKMLDMVVPSLEAALPSFGPGPKTGINIRMSNAFFVVAEGAPAGHRKAGGYSNAAFKCLDAAETSDDPLELLERAQYLFALCFKTGLDEGTLDWQITLIGSGDCETRLAPFTDCPAVGYRRAVRFFIRSREEGMKKWNGNWTTSISMQAKAHRALAELGENQQQNTKVAEFLEHRAATENDMPEPVRPEAFVTKT